MAQTLEEHLLTAALDGDDETVSRLAGEMLKYERAALRRAFGMIEDALQSVESPPTNTADSDASNR